MSKQLTVGGYLIKRLREAGLAHVFGVPGDYVLAFYDQLVASEIEVVGTCTEAGAGFAADAYARVNGLGAACVTYCVGGLNIINSVAGAYAEKSPLVVISGAPGMLERTRSPLLHHRVRDFDTQRSVFEKATAMAAALEDPRSAPRLIDEALATCLRYKRPVYLELPRDVVLETCDAPPRRRTSAEDSDPESLGEAVQETLYMLQRAKRPVILAGVEIHRFGLQEALRLLTEKSGFPIAATLLGKSVIAERHPQYLGVYAGAMSRDRVRRAVEASDCLLILGAFMSDINLGVGSAHLDPARAINATSERISIRHHHFEGAHLPDFVEALIKGCPKGRPTTVRKVGNKGNAYRAQTNRAITVKRFFRRMDSFIEDDSVVICDPGDSLFAALDLTIHRRTEFVSPAYYTSMGFAIPAALGVQIRKPKTLRPVVFVGDGAFQMTGQELSTIVRHGLDPIVFVLNNKGYTTERFINDGPYNDIQEWAYHRWPEVMGAGWGGEVHTEGDLEAALAYARENTAGFSIINVHLDPYDRSEALHRLGKILAPLAAGKASRQQGA